MMLACALAGLLVQANAAAAKPATAQQFCAQPTRWDADLQHTGWTRKDGAPAGLYSMAQDADGLLWFAARDGLYSFDGARFVRNDRVHGHELHSPVTMAVASYGDALWVGYQFGGISRFERAGARHYVSGDGAPRGSVHRFARTGDGVMWAATSAGLYRLDGHAWRPVGSGAGLPEGGLLQLTVLKDGSMLAYFPDGVYRSTQAPGTGRHRFQRVLDRPGVEGGELQPDGRVLVNSRAHGMQMFDPDSGATTPFALHNGGLPNLGYYSDAHGGLWVGTGESVQLLDCHGKVVRQFVTAGGFTASTFSANLTDREGNVWFVTPEGVDRVRPARLAMVALPDGFTGAMGVTPGDEGAVWIGTSDQLEAFNMRSIVLGADGVQRRSDIAGVTASHRQSDGALWFATGTHLWQVRAGSARRWPLPAGFAGRDVQAMTSDAAGTLWLSVVGMGVHTFRDGAWLAGGGHQELAQDTAVTLARDHEGRIWLGYTGDRIAVLDRDEVRRYGHAHGLAVGNTLAIVHGRQRTWIGGDRGLGWFDGARFRSLGERGRGSFSGVSGIAEREDGELWLHDTSGLARIDAAKLSGALPALVDAERFDHLDGYRGMPAQIRPLPTLVQASDGRLWFATSSGIGHIDPAAIPRNPRAPTVMVSALRTDRQAFAPDGATILPARTARLEIDFTATALTMPERVRFRYRLVGQDRGWRETAGLRQAVYTNLAPGAYTFEVSAANEDGVWSPQPARASFQIEPAFTQTAWFMPACVLAALAAAWLLHRWRLARLASRLHANLDLRLRERMLERERIARTLHDTFLQSVQALVLRMHVLLGRLPGDSGLRAEVEDVLTRAEDVIDEGREPLRQLRVPGLRHGCLAQALSDAGRELAAATGVAFVVRHDGKIHGLEPEIEDELFTIGREALSNAFHHARAGRITLALDCGADRLRLAVTDDGSGIAPDILASGARAGHWGLPGMRERARLAGGVLEIDSGPAGTTVSVCIPVTTAYQGMRRA